jgi:hypothetical protein
MAIFLVVNNAATTFKGGNAMVVSATDSAGALLAAAAQAGGDSTWSAATATQLADVAVTGANALVGWRFRVVVSTPTTGAVVADVTVTGDGTNDTLDEIGTALAVALNATAPIAAASYTGATQILLVAAGASDALGDKHVKVYVLPPVVNVPGGQYNQDVDHTVFVASQVHQGAPSADLTVTFAADTLIVPRVLAVLRRQVT